MNSFWIGLVELILFLIGCFFALRWFAGVGIGAPFVPARRRDVHDAFTLASVTATDIVIDLGSGDGRFLLEAAQQGAQVVGYELNPFLVWFSRFRLRSYPNAKVYRRNLFEADVTKATVIFVFQMGHVMPRLAQKLLQEAPRARVISVAFELPGYKVQKQEGVVKWLVPIDKMKEKV